MHYRVWSDSMIKWTAEEIAQLSDEKVKSLRDNAANRKNQEIVDRCTAELVRRKPPKDRPARTIGVSEDRSGQYVSEFHLVCPNELGVTRNQNKTIWTGTWVIAQTYAEAAVKYGSLVALHTSKADPSYLHGTTKAWRKSPRESKYSEDHLVKTESGIDFLFEPSDTPLQWKGDGSGEKGYGWAPIPE